MSNKGIEMHSNMDKIMDDEIIQIIVLHEKINEKVFLRSFIFLFILLYISTFFFPFFLIARLVFIFFYFWHSLIP